MKERREACVAHMEKTEELKKAVFGNGRKGLKYEIIGIKITNRIIIGLNILILGILLKLMILG